MIEALTGCLRTRSTIPLTPFPSMDSGQALARKGEEIVPEGHPQAPVKGASPLGTPYIHQPAR